MSDKPKCPVFGCTIPRGIPHEHPAGVSAVMRDPGAPLTDIERAELQYHRQQAVARGKEKLGLAVNQAWAGHTSCAPGQANMQWQPTPEMPMLPGRKLRDALLMAGNIPRTESTSFNVPGGGSVTVDTTPRSSDTEWTEVRRLSIVKMVGYFAAGIVIGFSVVMAIFFLAIDAGWL